MENVTVRGVSLFDVYVNLFIKMILKRSGRKRIYSSSEAALAELERMKRETPENADIPAGLKLSTLAGREEFLGSPLYRFSSEKKSGKTVVYLHGGAFVNQPIPRHFKAVDRLCADSGAEVFFPVYPKAPAHDYRGTYELVEALYRRLLETRGSEDIVFMGDSAGAMLCVTLCGFFAEKGLPLPSKLILYSLVADASLDNPEIARVDPKDPMQGADGLREYIRAWAGDEPLTSPLIDPMNADLSVLPETLIVCGENEVFTPDALIFTEKARAAGADVTCCVFKRMYHCFPLFSLRAAKTVRGMACDFLEK